MACNWNIEVLDGRIWWVGAHTIYGEPKHYPSNLPGREHAEVIIPLCQLHGLTAEQIGEAVLEMVPAAEACYAEHLASAYADSQGRDYYKRANGDDLASMIYRDLPYIERFANSEFVDRPYIQSAIDFLRDLKRRFEEQIRKPPSRRASKVRRVISKNYDAIFVRIGRRDGFQCGCCFTTFDLQIDHIVPVSKDGDSSDDNLQLLCTSCNSRKGDKTIDYRKASPDAKAQISTESDIHAQQPAGSQDLSGISEGDWSEREHSSTPA